MWIVNKIQTLCLTLMILMNFKVYITRHETRNGESDSATKAGDIWTAGLAFLDHTISHAGIVPKGNQKIILCRRGR